MNKQVNVKVDAGVSIGVQEHLWRYIGYDECNYTYIPEGVDLLKDVYKRQPLHSPNLHQKLLLRLRRKLPLRQQQKPHLRQQRNLLLKQLQRLQRKQPLRPRPKQAVRCV